MVPVRALSAELEPHVCMLQITSSPDADTATCAAMLLASSVKVNKVLGLAVPGSRKVKVILE